MDKTYTYAGWSHNLHGPTVGVADTKEIDKAAVEFVLVRAHGLYEVMAVVVKDDHFYSYMFQILVDQTKINYIFNRDGWTMRKISCEERNWLLLFSDIDKPMNIMFTSGEYVA